MADNIVIRINQVYADITDSENKSLGSFGISQVNTDFSVGAIPTCTVHINDGTEFTQTTRTKSNVMSLIAKQSTENLHIKISIKLSISGVSKEISEVIFNGVITSITMSYDFVGSGRSSKGIVITAIHRFADLYKFGAAGMIYAPARAITDATVIDNLVKSMTADSRANNTSSSTYSRPSVVRQVLEMCVPAEKSSSIAVKSIPDAIYEMVNVMRKGNILVPEKTDPKIQEYIKGTIVPNVKSKFVTEMYTDILTSVYTSVSSGNLADSIAYICNKNYGFYIAPRSVDYVSIIPSSYATMSPKEPPVITTDRYYSISYKPISNIGTDIQGVLVTKAGSSTYGNDGGLSLIRAKFPEDTGSEAVRWMCIPAPKWFDGASLLYGNSKDSGTTQDIDKSDEEKICKAYAADRYYNIRYSKNTVSMHTDVRSLKAYSALGGVFDISYPNDHIEGSDKIRATLATYQFSYRSSAEMSGLSISLGFTNAHSSALPVVAQPDHMLYSIKDTDKITEFPDLSKQNQQDQNT